jgi:hypothetical protein
MSPSTSIAGDLSPFVWILALETGQYAADDHQDYSEMEYRIRIIATDQDPRLTFSTTPLALTQKRPPPRDAQTANLIVIVS